MLLTAKTTLYVTSKDGTSEMSFLEVCNAIKGGLQLEEVERLRSPFSPSLAFARCKAAGTNQLGLILGD